jgi:phage/plasmid-associated DNA primase
MKAYTGGAKIQARKLHKDVIEFYPQFKLILTCNRLPHIPSNDGGTWRRIRLVPFEMKFVDNPNEDHERKINRKLESELRECREEFMSLLVERYKIYKKDGLSVPDKVMSFTESYQSNSDIYLDYINECIDYTNNKEDKMNLQEVITDMQYWLKNIRFEKRTYVRNDMKYELEEKLGKLGKRTFWKGYTLKVNPDLRKKNKLQLEEDGFDENIVVVNDDDDENIISTMDKIKGSKQKEVKLDI